MIKDLCKIALVGASSLLIGCTATRPREYKMSVSADFNKDGNEEIFTVENGQRTIFNYNTNRGYASTSWVVKSYPKDDVIDNLIGIYNSNDFICGLEAGDFDKDNNLDIGIYIKTRCQKLKRIVLYGNGEGAFRNSTKF